MNMRHSRRLRISCLSVAVISLCLVGCTTRNVVLTNTGAQPVTLSSTGNSSGWDYERRLEPGESFELEVGANQPISLPGLTVQVR